MATDKHEQTPNNRDEFSAAPVRKPWPCKLGFHIWRQVMTGVLSWHYECRCGAKRYDDPDWMEGY